MFSSIFYFQHFVNAGEMDGTAQSQVLVGTYRTLMEIMKIGKPQIDTLVAYIHIQSLSIT